VPQPPAGGSKREGQALVRAIEALETIEPAGPIERKQVRFLLRVHRRRLRAVVAAVPGWLTEELLSASQAVGEDRAAG